MSARFATVYREGTTSLSADALARRAGSYADALRAADARTVIVALEGRARIAAVVAACLAERRRAVFPHGFTGAILDSLAASHEGALVVHDRAGAAGLDLRALDDAVGAADGQGIDLAMAFEDAREQRLLTFMTSGSTGRPRAIVKRTRELFDEAHALVETLGIGAGARLGLGVPSSHVYGFLFGVAVPAVVPVVVHAPLLRTPSDLADAEPLDFFVAAPPTILSFSHAGGAERLRGATVVSSGSELPPAVAASALSAGAGRVVEIFGSTETGGIGYRQNVADAFTRLPAVTFEVDETSARVRSPYASADGAPVDLGDHLSVDPDGRFRFVERDTDRVKIGGRRISTGHVEALLRAIPGVHDAAVRPRRSSEARGSRLAALVVADAPMTTDLRRRLAAELDAEFVPRPILVVPRIARSPSGKLAEATFERQLQDGLRVARSRIELSLGPDGIGIARVGPDCSRLDGHFPGDPILPGVSLLLDVLMPLVHCVHADLDQPRRIHRVKFVRPVRPGDELRVRLERRGTDTITFDVRTAGGEKVSSGNLHFTGMPSQGRSIP